MEGVEEGWERELLLDWVAELLGNGPICRGGVEGRDGGGERCRRRRGFVFVSSVSVKW